MSARSKSHVTSWETVASWVATYPSDGGDGACDVDVQIGSVDGAWYVRTQDDAGGSDDADDATYASEQAARVAACSLAADLDESAGAADASAYLETQRERRIGNEDPLGIWGVLWEVPCDGILRVDSRYATREQAEAAAERAQERLEERQPGKLLCGYVVGCLDGDVWRTSDESEVRS